MQKKENFYTDNSDIGFHFDHKIDWDLLYSMAIPEDLTALGVANVEEYRKCFKDILVQIGEVSGSTIKNNQLKVAKQDLILKNGEVIFPEAALENLRVLNEIGLPALGISSRFGGLPTHIAAEMPLVEMLYRACPSTYLNVTWSGSVARMIDEFGSEAQKQAVIPHLATGEWSGNMALTEPDAGSDLGALRTYGEKQSDGSWRLFGSKRFITNGSSQVSLVLAKNAKGAMGLQNLNLYLCYHKNADQGFNYEVTKLEEKTGLHGSPTCELKFEGSKAELMGQEGHGFEYMLHLMNEARIAVAFQGVGIMEAVLRIAKDYTQQRQTWGRPIAQHELIAEKLLDMEVTTLASRSLCFRASNALAVYHAANRKLHDDKTLTASQKTEVTDLRKKYERKLRRWTPLVKYYAGEQAVYNARQCLQLHGGYGFTTEYLPEWWLRESLIIPVYEGTSQIQSLMCLKDTMKDIMRRPRAAIEMALGTSLANLSERNPLKRKLANLRQEFNASMLNIIIQLVKVNMKTTIADVSPTDLRKMVKVITKDLVKFENLRPALLNAERITEIKSLICMGESLIADAKIDSTRTWIAERWLNKALPKAQMLRAEIEMQEPVLAHRLAEVPPLKINT